MTNLQLREVAAKNAREMHKLIPRNAARAWFAVATLLSSSAFAALDSQVVFSNDNRQASPVPLSDSLIKLGREGDVSIVFPSSLLKGKLTPTVAPQETTLSTLETLNLLLANSGLSYKIINSQVIAITLAAAEAEQPDEYYLNLYQEEIAVEGKPITGSRIRKSYVTGASPIDVISQPELAASGAQTLGEFLKFIPTVAGNSTSTAVSNGGDGTATVTLRGLPANNTLVLLNGQRTAYSGLAGDAIDLNSIPPAAVERIEILKDGASAVYGSDAIAGVVNIILRSNFEGFQVEQFYGETSRSDLETATTSLLWGTQSNTASLMVAASYFDQQGIMSRDREVARSANNLAKGGADLRSSATPDGRITVNDQVLTLIKGQDGSSSSDFEPASVNDLFDYPAFTSSISPSTRASLFSTARLELNHTTSVFIDASYTGTEASITLAPTPLFTGFEAEPIDVDSSNIYNPFGQTLGDVRKRLVELGPREQINNAQAYRLNIGLEGDDGVIRWQLNQFWSRTNAQLESTNLLSGLKTQRALGDDTLCNAAASCVPLNVFGPEGSITQDMADYIRIDNNVRGNSQLMGLSLSLDSQLAALASGEVLAAGGFEVRRESTSRKPNTLENNDFYIGGGEDTATEGARNITEMFAELQIPLAQNTSWAHHLDLEIASRISHYSDFGTAVTPKAGLRYQPTANLLVRTTFSKGFRAPSLNELHKGGQTTQAFLDDPCANPNSVGVLVGCNQQSDPTRNQFLTEFSGSTNLEPESSNNSTLGIVWTPSTLPGLYAALDFFWIEQNDVVDASAQYIVNQNAEAGLFQDKVTRNAAGDIERIDASFINIGRREINGADLTLKYQHLIDAGLASISLNAAHLHSFKDQLAPSAATEELAGSFSDEASEGNGALPKLKANTGIHWQQDGLDLHYTINYVSPLEEEVPKAGTKRTIDSWITHDVQFNYLLPVKKGLKLTLGADNLLDNPAPFAASAFNDSMDSRTHDLKGRFWYGRVSLKF
ncbi:TonB-dependent receptor domain-containing protein [Simiduia litorea]|uniref:TonB-dependent receptor domain-containing protein n=1 Tax=Simiduia litorea TaxID=1435348 RepID=UPI0036F39959